MYVSQLFIILFPVQHKNFSLAKLDVENYYLCWYIYTNIYIHTLYINSEVVAVKLKINIKTTT